MCSYINNTNLAECLEKNIVLQINKIKIIDTIEPNITSVFFLLVIFFKLNVLPLSTKISAPLTKKMSTDLFLADEWINIPPEYAIPQQVTVKPTFARIDMYTINDDNNNKIQLNKNFKLNISKSKVKFDKIAADYYKHENSVN